MRFYFLDWWSLILLVCFILLGLACRVGAMGFHLSPLSDMSPATSDCLEPYFSGGFSFLFQLSRVCWLFWVLLFLSDMCTTEGVRVSWTSTDVRKYWVEIGTAFNVKTTTTTIFLSTTVFFKQQYSTVSYVPSPVNRNIGSLCAFVFVLVSLHGDHCKRAI